MGPKIEIVKSRDAISRVDCIHINFQFYRENQLSVHILQANISFYTYPTNKRLILYNNSTFTLKKPTFFKYGYQIHPISFFKQQIIFFYCLFRTFITSIWLIRSSQISSFLYSVKRNNNLNKQKNHEYFRNHSSICSFSCFYSCTCI